MIIVAELRLKIIMVDEPKTPAPLSPQEASQEIDEEDEEDEEDEAIDDSAEEESLVHPPPQPLTESADGSAIGNADGNGTDVPVETPPPQPPHRREPPDEIPADIPKEEPGLDEARPLLSTREIAAMEVGSEVVVHVGRFKVGELAQLAVGSMLKIDPNDFNHARLNVGGGFFAEGELVRTSKNSTKVALKITKLA